MKIIEDKVAYGDKVLMYREERRKLDERFGAADAARLVEILDDYLVNHPRKRYESHYRAILSWCVPRLKEEKIAEQRLRNAQEAGVRYGARPAVAPGKKTTSDELQRRLDAINRKYDD